MRFESPPFDVSPLPHSLLSPVRSPVLPANCCRSYTTIVERNSDMKQQKPRFDEQLPKTKKNTSGTSTTTYRTTPTRLVRRFITRLCRRPTAT